MSDLRKAAQQALEALEIASRNGADGLKRYELKELDDAIAALRAALAQPEPFQPDWDRVEALEASLREHMAEIQRLKKKSPEPEPEPVTWRYDYTRLPQRQPLTDADIKGIVDGGLQTWKLSESTYEFARAIERAHGIGGDV